MKRLSLCALCAALALLLLAPVCALGEAEVTIEEIIEASRTESILKHCNGFLLSFEMLGQPEASYDIYLDDEYYYFEAPDQLYLNSAAEECGVYDRSEENPTGLFYRTLNATGAPYDMSYCANRILDEVFTAKEEITEVRREGDQLYVVAVMPAEPTLEYFSEIVEMQEGDRLLVDFTLDAETLAIRKSSESMLHTDGTATPFCAITIEYGAPQPELMTYMLGMVAATTDLRTITLVLDPGTPQERSYSTTVPQGSWFLTFTSPGYAQIYADAECTTVFEQKDAQGDVTVYAKYEEPGEA